MVVICGIVGYSGKNEMKQEDLKILLYFAEDRGDQSCGVATPNDILKKAEDPHEFIIRELPTSNTVIGHTRAATTGDVTDENAHPFTSGSLVGVHNGVISNFKDLQEEEDTNYNVDSEIIWHMLNKYGLKDGLPKLQGWLALAWLDEKDRLNLYKHAGPIYVGEKDDALFFGSKSIYLDAMDCENVRGLDPWTHYVIDEGEIVEETNLSNINYRPSRRGQNFNRRTGSDTQEKEGGGSDESVSEQDGDQVQVFPRTDNVPDNADFTIDSETPGVGYYYWFGKINTNTLLIQPTSPELEGMDDRLPEVETFNLTSVRDVSRLERGYPCLINIQDIYKRIPAKVR